MKRVLIVLFVLMLFAVLATVGGILLSDGRASLGRSRVLTWRLDEPLYDHVPFQGIPFFGAEPGESLATVYETLTLARADAGVRGLAVYIQNARFGLATAQELRGLLASVSAAGKWVNCYLETAGEGGNGTLAYYLASACDAVSLAPAGQLAILGLYADTPFLRGALDKLKIEPSFRHVGAYKSADETFTAYEHSPAAEEAIAAILDDYYGQIVGDIADARKLAPAAVRALIDRAPLLAAEAQVERLVDRIEYPDEFQSNATAAAAGAPLVGLADYRRLAARPRGRRIAVVFAQGTILRGSGGYDPWSEQAYLGSDDLGEILENLADDDGVEAVVLRIDSPGGSALASDLILRSVELLAAKKPVIASMSDVAASGGYYIASKARSIVASPATLTGSIGVVGGKLATRRFQQELLGISHDTLQRGANADLFAGLDAFTEKQGAIFERMMLDVYDTFVGHVAAGRQMSRAEVERVAQGRVWSGARAHRLGLVDELGGLDAALSLARRAAGITDDESVRLEFLPRPATLFDLFFDGGEPVAAARFLGGHDSLLLDRLGLLELPPDLASLAQP